MDIIAKNIKVLRKYLDMTQTEFGEQLNVKTSTVAGWENGLRSVNPRTINDICRVFKVDNLWLTTGEGEMFANQTDDDILAQIDVIMCGESTIHKNMIKSLVSLSEEQLLAIDAAIDKYIALKDGEK